MSSNELIAILMAVYNGEKYIGHQIESIIHQSYKNWKLYIRDDGSNDKTIEIIQMYVNKDKRIVYYKDDEKLGVPGSFYKLLKVVNSEWYAFCDQDDYWYPNKLERAILKFREHENTKPILYFSDYNYVNENGEVLRKSPDQTKNIKFTLSLYNSLSSGFVLVFNKKLRDIATPEVKKDYGEYHDRRFIRTALAFGQVIYDHYVTADHIRHDSAVTSANKTKGSLIKNFIENELFGNNAEKEGRALTEFYYDFSKKLDKQNKKILEVFTENHSLKKFFFPHRLRVNLSGELALRLLFLMRKL